MNLPNDSFKRRPSIFGNQQKQCAKNRERRPPRPHRWKSRVTKCRSPQRRTDRARTDKYREPAERNSEMNPKREKWPYGCHPRVPTEYQPADSAGSWPAIQRRSSIANNQRRETESSRWKNMCSPQTQNRIKPTTARASTTSRASKRASAENVEIRC